MTGRRPKDGRLPALRHEGQTAIPHGNTERLGSPDTWSTAKAVERYSSTDAPDMELDESGNGDAWPGDLVKRGEFNRHSLKE